MICKNIECSNEVIGKKVYCSLSCRNIYVNKYLRSYDKLLETNEKGRLEKEQEYLKSPKLCKCGEVIPYLKRRNKYCNHSCKATYINSNRDYSLWSDNIKKGIHKYLIDNNIRTEDNIGKYEIICSNCNTIFVRERGDIEYCSDKCRRDYDRKDKDA